MINTKTYKYFFFITKIKTPDTIQNNPSNYGYSYDKCMVNRQSLLGCDVATTTLKTPRFACKQVNVYLIYTAEQDEGKCIHFELRLDQAEDICDE